MSKARVIAAYLFVIGGVLILLGRYAYLQIFVHQHLLLQSIDNYSSIVATQPVRGGILDQNGIILADNRLSYALAILPHDGHKITEIFTQLESYINLSSFDKKKYYKQLKLSKNYDWVIIKDDLSNIEVARLTAHFYLLPELSVFAQTKRYYPFDDLYVHSLG